MKPSRAKSAPEPAVGWSPGAWLGRVLAAPETHGDRARTVVGTFVLHLRPVRVPKAAIRFTHTFGLGGMSLVLLCILVVTGSLLMLGYTPVPGEAYVLLARAAAGMPSYARAA